MSVDIAIFRSATAGATPVQSLTAVAYGGDEIDGYPKVVQWVISQLFSRYGSTPFRTTEGSSFVARVVDGRASTDSDVRAVFAASVLQVMTTANGRQTSSTPAAETVVSISLGKLTIYPGQLVMSVTVRTAGMPSSFKVPITLNLGAA